MIKNGKYMGVTDENPFPDMYKLPYWAEEKVRQSYLECAKKGVTPPLDATLNNLPDTISEINTRPENPLQIDSGGAVIKKTTWSIAPATDVGYRGCYNLFRKADITSADLSTLTAISGEYSCYYMFYDCASLEESTLNNVETITGHYSCEYMFDSTNIPATNLGKLREIHGLYACDYMFNLCPNVTETGLDSLESIAGVSACANMFAGTPIKVARFPKLMTIAGNNAVAGLLKSCTQLTDVYFDSLLSVGGNNCFGTGTNQMLSGCENVTVHFPVGLQTMIGNWTAVLNGFGGTNTTVLFDLGIETTITVPANTYLYFDGIGLISDGTNTEPITVTGLTPAGNHKVYARNDSLQTIVSTTVQITEDSPSFIFNFNDYEYGIVVPTNNVGAEASYTCNIDNNLVTYDKFIINVGTTANISFSNYPSMYIDYPTHVSITVAEGMQECMMYLYEGKGTTIFRQDNDFGNIELGDYWSIDENTGYLTVHPTISGLYNTSRGINYTVQNEDLHGVRVFVLSYPSSEQNYDFGFVSFGTEQISPTASEIKAGTISNGMYICRESGVYHNVSEKIVDVVSPELISAGNKVVTVGWGQDSTSSSGDNSYYVLEIKLIEF